MDGPAGASSRGRRTKFGPSCVELLQSQSWYSRPVPAVCSPRHAFAELAQLARCALEMEIPQRLGPTTLLTSAYAIASPAQERVPMNGRHKGFLHFDAGRLLLRTLGGGWGQETCSYEGKWIWEVFLKVVIQGGKATRVLRTLGVTCKSSMEYRRFHLLASQFTVRGQLAVEWLLTQKAAHTYLYDNARKLCNFSTKWYLQRERKVGPA